ncbi:MAG: GNAT family N-acetyltransferase [Acidimicrobiales bacterium]
MIRPVAEGDVDEVLELIHHLAEYERSASSVLIDRGLLEAALFCASPRVFGHVAEREGRLVGMAIWFVTFSTWTGHHGIYLEDLYVRPEARGQGIGTSLLAELAALARREHYTRIEWSVLDWNEPALAFYRSIGAQPKDEWTVYRIDGDALGSLAEVRW